MLFDAIFFFFNLQSNLFIEGRSRNNQSVWSFSMSVGHHSFTDYFFSIAMTSQWDFFVWDDAINFTRVFTRVLLYAAEHKIAGKIRGKDTFKQLSTVVTSMHERVKSLSHKKNWFS